MTPEQEKNIIEKSKIEADKLWNEIGAYQDFNSDKIYTVEDDIAYLKYLDSTDQLKQTVYEEITDLVKFSTENANKKTYFDKDYLDHLAAIGAIDMKDFKYFDLNNEKNDTEKQIELLQKQIEQLQQQAEELDVINKKELKQKDKKTNNIKTFKMFLQTMNIDSDKKMFIPITYDITSPYHKKPIFPFKDNKEMLLSAKDMVNGCRRSWTTSKGKEMKNKKIKSLGEGQCFAMIIPEGYMILDADDIEDAKIIHDFVKSNNINCNIIKTSRGMHFYFKYDNNLPGKMDAELLLKEGLRGDMKLPSMQCTIPFNCYDRKILTLKKQLDYIPDELKPLQKQNYSMINNNYNSIQFVELTEPIDIDVDYILRNAPHFYKGSRNEGFHSYISGLMNNQKLWYKPNFEEVCKRFNANNLHNSLPKDELKATMESIWSNAKSGRWSFKEKIQEDLDVDVDEFTEIMKKYMNK